MKRRTFTTALATLSATPSRTHAAGGPHISTNTYPWGTFAKREGRNFVPHTDEALAEIAAAGIGGYEPAVKVPEEFDGLGARLKKHGLEMRSLYVNSSLHDEAEAGKSIEGVIAIARRAAETGTKIIVTNPSPIKWGGPQNKTDAQLVTQAAALDKLGAELGRLGMQLAYHNHDIELRTGAREFHHMLTATNPAHVKFCLDVHWVFRGCGDSQVALFDVLEHYGSRVIELHVRQSVGGKWAEVFTAEGDIDYERLVGWFSQHRIKPLLTLEQCIEAGSPGTLTGLEAHKQSLANAQKIFAPLA
ncbi:MAG: sugar phosphate isomerase/epimerase [Verrucomicrobiaceae bacterium]|nr:sugar phosphate isomerase/epimerase [Verrucomicrobiaceae bacterium]